MANTKMVFQRLEKKYLITRQQKEQILTQAGNCLTADAFQDSTICNIYFDTEQYSLITTSIQKPPYKEKLRLRSYGIPDEESIVYLEIKKKWKGIVNKRRIPMTLAEANIYIQTQTSSKTSQIQSEIDYFMRYYQPIPKVYLAYERNAMVGVNDLDLRLTFDEHIRRRYDHLDLAYGDQGELLLSSDQILMEIKVPGAYPLWLTHILSAMNLYPISFSKYGNVFIEDIVKGKRLSSLTEENRYVTEKFKNESVQKERGVICLQAF